MSTIIRYVPLVVMVLFLPLRGDSPVWWTAGVSQVILTDMDENNHGPATIGQAKWMARQALKLLGTIDATLAGKIRQALTQAQTDSNGAILPALLDFDIPAGPLPPDWRDRQHAPLLLGQLKAISAPFYQSLHAVAPLWLDHESTDPAEQGQLQLNGTKDQNDATNFYPWTSATADDANHAVATIGQLKAVFALRFESLDLDGDGLRDRWELAYFPNLAQTGDGDWDGDGLTNMEEQVHGLDPRSFGSDNNHDGIADDWQSVHAGTFAVYPPLLQTSLYHLQQGSFTAYLSNDTDQAIDYSITLNDKTGPLYRIQESITGEASHDWQDISRTGTLLETISNADNACEAVNLTQFAFPFYGKNYDQVFISTNGLVSFGKPTTAYQNSTLPTSYPNCALIAALWDDLDTRTTGAIYYQEEQDRLIIQYDHVGKHEDSRNHTFQIILYDSGRIDLQYYELTGITTSCTIGIQDATLTRALQVLYNKSYLTNRMAVEIHPRSECFEILPLSGSIPAHTITPLAVVFNSLTMPAASYDADMIIEADGRKDMSQMIPLRLRVLDYPCAVSLVQPLEGGSQIYSQALEFRAVAEDEYGVVKVEFFDGETLLGTSLQPPYSLSVDDLMPGERSFMARITNRFGRTHDSWPVSFTILADTDEDGLPDEWEIEHGFNPYDPADALGDEDGDSRSNLDEYRNSSDPWVAEDSDGDGMPDGWEMKHGLNLARDDGARDADTDELSNSEEFRMGANPRQGDTDGDQLPDGWEVQWSLNPLSVTGRDGTYGDSDRDGVSNIRELIYGSSPTSKDTDGDGSSDGIEVNQGTYANDASDDGKAPDWDDTMAVKIIIGDPSGSHSERWAVKVKDLKTGKTILNHQSESFGELSEEDNSVFRNFRKDRAYEFRLVHLDTAPGLVDEDPYFYPDYDWALEIGIQNKEGNFIDVMDSAQKTHLVLDPWDPEKKEVSDTVHLLVGRDALEYPWEGQPDRNEQYEKQIAPKRVVIFPVAAAVDSNRDGEITLDGQDDTTQDQPFRFWINNDQDDVEYDEPIMVEHPDSFDRETIRTKRDLEDFCRLKVSVGLPNAMLREGDLQIGLMFRNTSNGTPGIRLWQNQSADGTLEYLKDFHAAARQLGFASFEQFPPDQVTLIPKAYWATREDSTAHLIFEGTATGTGELVVTVHDKYGARITEGGSIWLQLLDVREMYQRAKIRNEAESIPDPWVNANPPAQSWTWDPNGKPYVEDPRASSITTIFVHGWRLTYWDYVNWSDTSYKRLWQQGFKGKFYAFRWPTFSGDNNGLPYGIDEQLEDSEFPPGGLTYNASEYRAWLSGPALADFVNQLPNPKNRRLFAHSMGNVVSGSALRAGMEITSYAMCNAAMAAMAYDANPMLKLDSETGQVLTGIFNVFDAYHKTPDDHHDAEIRTNYGLENKFNLTSMPPVFNFGLPNDQALGKWSANNLYFKPNMHYLYEEDSVLHPYPLVYQLTPISPYRSVTSQAEAMGYVTKATTRTAGADLRTRGCVGVNNTIGMSSWFGETHSAQWRWNYSSTCLFWEKLFESLELNKNAP